MTKSFHVEDAFGGIHFFQLRIRCHQKILHLTSRSKSFLPMRIPKTKISKKMTQSSPKILKTRSHSLKIPSQMLKTRTRPSFVLNLNTRLTMSTGIHLHFHWSFVLRLHSAFLNNKKVDTTYEIRTEGLTRRRFTFLKPYLPVNSNFTNEFELKIVLSLDWKLSKH